MMNTNTFDIPDSMLRIGEWLTTRFSQPYMTSLDSFTAGKTEIIQVNVTDSERIVIDPVVLHYRMPNLRRIEISNASAVSCVNMKIMGTDDESIRLQVCLHLTGPYRIAAGKGNSSSGQSDAFRCIRLNLTDVRPDPEGSKIDDVLAYSALCSGTPREKYQDPALFDSLVKAAASRRKEVMLLAIREHNEWLTDLMAGLRGTRAETWEAWADAAASEGNVLIRAKILDAMHKTVDTDSLQERKDARDMKNILNPFTLDNMKKIMMLSRVGREGFRISGAKPEMTDLVIPEEIEGKPVVEISDRAFQSNHSNPRHFTYVCLGPVRRIGNDAFSGTEIESLEFGTSLYRIGQNAFSSVTFDQKEIRIPDTVRLIDEFAFSNTNAVLEGLPSGLLRIGNSAFLAWNWDRVSNIHGDIDLPHLTYLGNGAFQKVMGMNRVRIGNAYLEEGCFRDCSVREARVESGVISESCFADCGLLLKLEFPNARIIGRNAMRNCTVLKQVTLGPDLEYIEGGAFYNVPEHCVFMVPEGCEDSYQAMLETSGLDHPLIRTYLPGETVPSELSAPVPVCTEDTEKESRQMDFWSCAV